MGNSELLNITKDTDFLARVQRLAKDANALKGNADAIAELIQESNAGSEYVKVIENSGLMAVMCGASGKNSSDRSRLELFWGSMRTFVSAQFGEFSLDGRAALKKIFSTLEIEERPGRAGWDHDYWAVSWDKVGANPGNFTAESRAHALLTLLLAVLPTLEQWYRNNVKLPSNLGASEFMRGIRDSVLKSLPQAIRDSTGRKDKKLLAPVRLFKLRQNLDELTDRILAPLDTDEKTKKRTSPQVKAEKELHRAFVEGENDLFSHLERLLRRGKVDSQALDISDTVRILGGRYLNPTLQLEPDKRDCFSEAVSYVLEKQNEFDGSWWGPETSQDQKQTEVPLVTRYYPLACLLDLPNEVLKSHLLKLTIAAERAVTALQKRLEGYEVQLKSGSGDEADIVRTVCGAFVTGTAVADRFKDLLSDAVLDNLGAEEAATEVVWQTVPDSLGFKNNIERGVIDLWEKRNDQRPGAILIYGPPGTGKTTIARVLARKLNEKLGRSPGEGGPDRKWKFLEFTPADFARGGSDQIVASAEKIFEQLKQVRRCVVLLDEMEEFLRTRGPGSEQDGRLITTAFLPLLQEAVQSREIILIVATNFVGNIDSAVTRRGRFDLILPVGPPEKDSRGTIIESLLWPKGSSRALGQRLCESTGLDQKDIQGEIVNYTMGYSRPEIEDFVRELERSVPTELSSRDNAHSLDAKSYLKNKADLVMRLWGIRQEHVPTALSGAAGSNWRTFQDEALRYRRMAAGADNLADDKYWTEPHLPDWKHRKPATDATEAATTANVPEKPS